jgi:membrane protease YdiL (CAAX protease family)
MRIFWSPTEARLRAGWRFAIQLAGNLGLAVLAWWALRQAAGDWLQVTAWADLARYAVLFAVTVLTVAAAARWLDRRPFADLGLHLATPAWWGDFAFGVVLAVVPIVAMALLAWALGWVTVRPALASGIPGLTLVPALLVALLTYTFVAFFEELARAYQIRNLFEGTRGRLGLVGAAVVAGGVATLISVVMHIGPPLFLFFVFLDMAMYALCYLLTGRIAVATGHHLAWDLMLAVVLVVQGVLPLDWPAALFFVEPAEGVVSLLNNPTPLAILLAIMAVLLYEALNVLLLLGWVRWRREHGLLALSRAQ